MKTTLIALALALTPGLASAEALKKYAVPETVQSTAIPTAVAPPQAPPDALSPRQRLAVQTVLKLPPKQRKQWLDTFAKREKAAVARKDYEAAQYYQEIIEAVTGAKK